MIDLVREHAGVDVHPSQPVEELRAIVRRARRPVRDRRGGPGKLVLEIYEKTTEANIAEPDVRVRLPARGLTARARRTATTRR